MPPVLKGNARPLVWCLDPNSRATYCTAATRFAEHEGVR